MGNLFRKKPIDKQLAHILTFMCLVFLPNNIYAIPIFLFIQEYGFNNLDITMLN
jgi:hypothetical protein